MDAASMDFAAPAEFLGRWSGFQPNSFAPSRKERFSRTIRKTTTGTPARGFAD